MFAKRNLWNGQWKRQTNGQWKKHIHRLKRMVKWCGNRTEQTRPIWTMNKKIIIEIRWNEGKGMEGKLKFVNKIYDGVECWDSNRYWKNLRSNNAGSAFITTFLSSLIFCSFSKIKIINIDHAFKTCFINHLKIFFFFWMLRWIPLEVLHPRRKFGSQNSSRMKWLFVFGLLRSLHCNCLLVRISHDMCRIISFSIHKLNNGVNDKQNNILFVVKALHVPSIFLLYHSLIRLIHNPFIKKNKILEIKGEFL